MLYCMRKTLYFDSDTNKILDELPAREQSDFVRKAVNYYFRNKNDIEKPQATKLRITKVIR